MKKIITTVVTLMFFSLCLGQNEGNKTPNRTPSTTAAFHWANTTHDFGKTRLGIPVSYEFRFTNTGMTPLIISSVKVSCDCTVTAYTRDPVEKGATGFVRATYDGTKAGIYSKSISVLGNTPEGTVLLTIKGEIVE